MVTEADSLKYTEIKGAPAGAFKASRPLRKRGYHRALKSGKSWALMENGIKNMWGSVLRDMFIDKNCPSNMIIGLSKTLE